MMALLSVVSFSPLAADEEVLHQVQKAVWDPQQIAADSTTIRLDQSSSLEEALRILEDSAMASRFDKKLSSNLFFRWSIYISNRLENPMLSLRCLQVQQTPFIICRR